MVLVDVVVGIMIILGASAIDMYLVDIRSCLKFTATRSFETP